MHIAGNMLYLWVFGNNIEDVCGHGRFLLFYLLCGLVAAFAQALPNPASEVPMIGASGAISGVLGAYLLLFPHARVRVLIPLGLDLLHHGPRRLATRLLVRLPAAERPRRQFGQGRGRLLGARRRLHRRPGADPGAARQAVPVPPGRPAARPLAFARDHPPPVGPLELSAAVAGGSGENRRTRRAADEITDAGGFYRGRSGQDRMANAASLSSGMLSRRTRIS